MAIQRAGLAVLVAGLVALGGACGSDSDPDDGAAAPAEREIDDEQAGDGQGDATGFESEQCDLFTDDEIEAEIGAHDGGGQDFVFGGCVWQALASDDGGFTPAIHAAVLSEAMYETVAEVGEPVPGFGEGATYDEISGELWFPCRDDERCGIKGHIADADEREDVVRRLGELLRDRI